MKTPEEYLENLTFNPNTLAEEVIEIIKQVQKETWNEAIDRADEEAEVEIIDYDDIDNRMYPIYGVSSNSILKLKI